MTQILTLVLAAVGFVLASCATAKSQKGDSCCEGGSAASCCSTPGKAGGHSH